MSGQWLAGRWSLPCRLARFFGALALAVVLAVCGMAGESEAAGLIRATSSEQEIQDLREELEGYDFSEIQDLLDQNAGTDQLRFSDLVLTLIGGDVATFGQMLLQYIGQALAGEVATSRSGLWQVLLLATIGALFANLTAVFEKEGISEMGFFVTYLLLASTLLASFLAASEVAANLVTVLLNFMSALLPAFFLAMAISGGNITALAFYEFIMIVIAVIQWLLANVLLPFVQVYVVVVMLSYLSKEEMFTKTTELLETLLNWGLRMLLGVVTGYSMIQGLILPHVDAVQAGAVTKLISALPGIGNSVSSLTSLVLGSGTLIKNGIGTAALIALVFLSVVPLCKLAVIYLMHAAAQALLEPVSDKRVVGCVSGVAVGTKLLLKTAFTALLLFLILIAMMCAFTSAPR